MGVEEQLGEELQRPRAPEDHYLWVKKTLREISNDDDLRKRARRRKGHLKELFEEALPLAIYSKHRFPSGEIQFELQHELGNQSYDVRVLDKATASESFLEMTQAHEGEAEHLRMLKLNEDGHVSPYGAVTKTGTKQTGIRIEICDEAYFASTRRDEEIEKIRVAVARKSEKAYPKGTTLIVAFDDYTGFEDAEDFDLLVHTAVREWWPLLEEKFDGFALVGGSEHTYLQIQDGTVCESVFTPPDHRNVTESD